MIIHLLIYLSLSHGAPSMAFVKNLAQDMVQVYQEELGIILEPTIIPTRIHYKPATLSSWLGQYNSMSRAVRQRAGRLNVRGLGLRILILGPIQDGSRLYMAGATGPGCRLRANVSVLYLGEVNADGASRYWQDLEVMNHELGHQLGAGHDNNLPATVMHYAANMYLS